MILKRFLLTIALMLLAAPMSADWFKDYEAGLDAAKKENWQVVVQKMTTAIADKGEEGRVKPYGTIFVEYRPYYYRGVAYLNLGDFEKALADLRKTKGPGSVQLGSVAELRDRAETKLAQSQPSTQTSPSTTTAVATTTREPVAQPPAVDPAVRREAEQMLAEARVRANTARQARAETYAAETFNSGSTHLSAATNRSLSADTTADWRAVRDSADKAIRNFEASIADAQTAIAALNVKPTQAAEEVVGDIKTRVRDALEDYFDGDFKTAVTKLNRLVNGEAKDNAMLWAFLGAAHYYNYYLEDTAASRQNAVRAFKKARNLKNGSLNLNERYFSARVRDFYRKETG